MPVAAVAYVRAASGGVCDSHRAGAKRGRCDGVETVEPGRNRFTLSWWTTFHHSTIMVGYFEESNLVVIYDVNPDYGLFFVDAKRLYDAVATYPLLGAAGRPLGLVLCEISK